MVAPEVAAALASGRAVVALESTIVSHGMPYPQNLAMVGDAVQAEIRSFVRSFDPWIERRTVSTTLLCKR